MQMVASYSACQQSLDTTCDVSVARISVDVSFIIVIYSHLMHRISVLVSIRWYDVT